MGRQPFITADLRPDLRVSPDVDRPDMDQQATTKQFAESAGALLSEGERRQVERGMKEQHVRLMQTVPCPNPNVQGTTLDGETVLLDLSSGRYYTLNRVGTAIWERCDSTRTLTMIHRLLCDRFEAPSERIADDLVALVTRLGHEGLLTLGRR